MCSSDLPLPDRAAYNWQGHTLQLLAARAIWEPERRTLLVADLHLGKAETFQRAGIPLPSDGDLETLNALIALAQAEGAKLIRVHATGFRIEAGRLKSVTTSQGEVACDAAVIAAGVHSKPLARAAGDDVPLESERGYHAEISEIGRAHV